MKKWQWIILGIVVYFLFLLVYMPAQYLTSYIQQSSQGKLSFTGVDGTLFSGSATDVRYEGLRVQQFNWDLSPLSLLLLKAEVDIKGGEIRNSDKIYLDGNVQVSFLNTEAFDIKNARVFVPVKPLFAQVDLPVVVTALGRVRVDIDSFSFDQGCEQLDGKGSWLQAAFNIEGRPLDLGNLNASLACESPNFALQVSPDNGISLDAKILFNHVGRYAAEGSYVIPSNYPNEVKMGTSFFGPSLGQGRYKLNIKSRDSL